MIVRYGILAYGGQDAVHRQATLLVLSLLAHAPAPREMVVVTDRADKYAWFGDLIGIRVLPPGDLATWCGPNPFSMRQKIEAARAVMPADGALVFLDADTLITGDLTPLAAALARGALLMHRREFELGTSRRSGNRKLWESLRGRTFGPWHFEATDAMWNSGVIALPASDARLLDDALTLYDTLASAGVRHFATEQLVVGLVFGRTGRLAAAEQWVLHYWGNKENFDVEISRRIEEAQRLRLSAAAAAQRLRERPIQLRAEVRPGKVEKIRRWWRTRGSR